MAPRTCNYTLTDKKIQAAKPKAKPYPLADAGGLYVDVLTSSSKVWRYSYRIDGKRTKVTIGSYPAIGIKAARNTHEDLVAKLAAGIDPARQKQLDKINAAATTAQAQTFETFSRVWFAEKMTQATARTQKQNLAWMVNDVFPVIGAIPLGQVHASDVLKLLVTYNPATAMKGLIDKPPATHYPPLKPNEIRRFLEAVRTCGAHQGTRLAVEFLMLTVVRKDNVCKAHWEHVDLKKGTWTIPRRTTGGNGFMKMPQPHTVYLSRQALALLEKARYLSDTSEWGFPSVQTLSKPMVDVAINHLFSRLRANGASVVCR